MRRPSCAWLTVLLLALLLACSPLPHASAQEVDAAADSAHVSAASATENAAPVTGDADAQPAASSTIQNDAPIADAAAEGAADSAVPPDAAAGQSADAAAAKSARAKAARAARAESDRRARAAESAEKAARKAAADAAQQKRKAQFEHSPLAAPVKRLRVSYYDFLKVSPDASMSIIRRAANKFALENHPDKACVDQNDLKCLHTAREQMLILNAAREALLSEEKREQYDFLLRFGFKVWDADLYKDVKADWDAGREIRGGWGEDEGYDPHSDPFESMQLTESSAGWLLLITGGVTLALMALPIIKFWRAHASEEERRLQLKKGLQQSLAKGRQAAAQAEGSNKKHEKYSGPRGGGANASPEPAPATAAAAAAAPAAAKGPQTTTAASSRSNKSRAGAAASSTVAILCLILALVALLSPASAAAARQQTARDAFAEPAVTLSYYELLEVSTDADNSALKKAYRSAALKWHPDRFVDRLAEQAEASAKFVLIAEAYDVLGDSVKRKEYNILLEHGFLTYDLRQYAEIMNEKNRRWAGAAGFSFSRPRRRTGPNGEEEEEDDTWMLLAAAFVAFVSLAVPIFQLVRKRARALAKKKEGAAEFKRTIAASTKREMDERAHAEQDKERAQAAAAAAAAERAEDDEDDEDKSSSLSAEALAEREERRAAKAAHKKNKVLFRTLIKHVLVATAASTATTVATPAATNGSKKSKGASTSAAAAASASPAPLQADEVDAFLSFLASGELESLVAELWQLLGSGGSVGSAPTAAAAGVADALETPSAQALPKVARVLKPILERFRAHQASEAENESLRLAERRLAARRAEESAGSSGSSGKTNAEWTPAELSMLAKGTAKFPGGINNRWEKIAELVSTVGGGRSMKEVIAQSREQDIRATLKRHDGAAFDTYLTQLKATKPTTGAAAPSAATVTEASTAIPAVAVKAKKPDTPVAAPSSSAAAAPSGEPVDEWNAEQQAALELALRTVSKSAGDRWEQIAACVPGKSKKQVVQRFKLIKAQLTAAQNK